jgi:hypothetical protein
MDYANAAELVTDILNSAHVPQFVRDAIADALTNAGNETQMPQIHTTGGFNRRALASMFRHCDGIGLRLFGGRLMTEEDYKSAGPPAPAAPDLAEMIAAVWHHPDCPQDIKDGIDQGTSELFNTLCEGERRVYRTAPYIRGLLAEHKAQQGGAARDH